MINDCYLVFIIRC